LQWKFRQLYSFALNKNISLKAFRSRDILDQFWTPLSQEASSQLQELQFLLQQIQANPSEAHKWSYIWNNDEFNSRKAYLKIIVINNASPIFKWMWKYCWGGHIFFLWLLLHDLVNTRELLKRKNMELPDYNCVMCNINSEKKLVTSILPVFLLYCFYGWSLHEPVLTFGYDNYHKLSQSTGQSPELSDHQTQFQDRHPKSLFFILTGNNYLQCDNRYKDKAQLPKPRLDHAGLSNSTTQK
jgi:hypothetical protein